MPGHAWPLQGGHTKVHMTNQRNQAIGQAWLRPQLPRHCQALKQPSRPTTLLAAVSKPAANTDAVRAEFSRVGIPGEVTTKVLKQYNCYLRWDPETKLRPALQLWVERLGSQQLSARLDRFSGLLRCTPEECNGVYLWLASIGVDAEGMQQKSPEVMARPLSEVQRTVRAIQQALQLTDEQLPAFFKRHDQIIRISSERVAQTLQTVSELLAVPVASKEMQEVVMVCSRSLFNSEPAELGKRIAFFCEESNGGQHAAKAALKQGLYLMSAQLVRACAVEVKAMLGWTEDELNQVLRVYPRILAHEPATVASNMQKLQAHNFTSAQALNVYASQPSLAGRDWNSSTNVEKLMYLMLILQLSTAEIASKPVLLSYSLDRRIGPRSEFIYRSKAITPDTPFQLSSRFLSYSDADFAKFENLSACPPLTYNEGFRQHWRQRWTSLTVEMGLTIADISACRALSLISLPNTLAPRWHFLNLRQDAQADFKAADHLSALATLSDERFAQQFNMANVGLMYNNNFMQGIQAQGPV